ncbi:MAG: hypothetical protein GY906_25790 [bacterium]|nr:hypothetical protein [bacterium]
MAEDPELMGGRLIDFLDDKLRPPPAVRESPPPAHGLCYEWYLLQGAGVSTRESTGAEERKA